MGLCPQGIRIVYCLVSRSFWAPVFESWTDNSWKLPALNVDPDSWTIQGLSGGNFMANNMHTSQSSRIKGAGLAIGTCYANYYQPFDWGADTNNAQLSYDKSQLYSDTWKAIDNTDNLKDQPVYVLSGMKDTIIKPVQQESIRDYYNMHGANVHLEQIANMWHTYPSIFWGADNNPSYRGFDGFGNTIKYILENLQKNAVGSVSLLTSGDRFNYENCGVLRKFSQTEFSEAFLGFNIGLDDYGWIFIPNACLTKQCKAHMFFHGSGGSVSSIRNTGFVDILDMGGLQYGCSLDLIVIYPMVRSTFLLNPTNSWNSLGFLQLKSQEVFGYFRIMLPFLEPMATKESIQQRLFMRIFERVSEPKDEKKFSYEDNDKINYIKMSTEQREDVQAEINRNHFWELFGQMFFFEAWDTFSDLKFF